MIKIKMLVYVWILMIASGDRFDCKFTMYDGKEMDFSSLYSAVPDYEDEQLDFVYRGNICGNMIKSCGSESAIATQWNHKGGCVAVIARQGPKKPTAEYLDVTDPSKGVRIKYFNGDMCRNSRERSVTYNVHCSKKDKTRLGLVQEPSECSYTFDFFSDSVCGTPVSITKPSTWKWYTWAGVLAIASLIVYFAGGIFINKRKDPDLSFSESIPNRDFWNELPSHLSRAVEYCISSVKGLIDRVRGQS